MKALLLCLLILSNCPAWSQPSTVEQIVSSIEPEKWYQGSDVRDAISQILLIAQDEIRATAEQAVIAATTELVKQNTAARAELEAWKWGAIGATAAFLIALILSFVK